MTPAIRPAGAGDLEALRVLLRDTWHATYDAIYGAARVEEITADWHSIEAMESRLTRPASRFLVAETAAGIVGMGFAAVEEPGVLFLHQLYVHPDAQRAGVGGALLGALVGQTPSPVERTRVDVEIANRPAVAFYERQGFAPAGLEADTSTPRLLRMERAEGG